MTDAVRARYERFARDEAPGRSAMYVVWARGVAGDAEVLSVLDRLDERHRQPPLVFAVSRLRGAPLGDYRAWREFVLAHVDDVVAECRRRAVQTNEPLRLAAMLPALSEVDGPIALLELGAAAGLCLYPDRYSFRFIDGSGRERARIDPEGGPSPVRLVSRVSGELPPLRMPQIVWRAGIDIAPLDAADADDRAWLEALIWPGETERAERIAAALQIVAADPPLLIAGDVAARLNEAVASAPADATLVVMTPGVLVYLPRAERLTLIERIRALDARWITIDPPALHDAWRPALDASSWNGFAVALDGRVRAAADPLGRWWEWRAGSGPDAA
ncbi:DUF2332 family protein [Microbacterium sp. NPDC058345]|uniref:DUF2332 family protein n=1 Tax=Microbacterium sp. NPDC058345 TaxID=3346455 RepID=UPI0036594080